MNPLLILAGFLFGCVVGSMVSAYLCGLKTRDRDERDRLRRRL